MSRKRQTNKRNNLANEKPTRKSARLNNFQNEYVKCQTQEMKQRATSRRNINTCPVLTRSRGRCMQRDISCSKCHESSIAETSSDTDGNFVKTLTYSSSDSNTRKQNMSKRSNILISSCCQKLVDKKIVDVEENSEKENAKARTGNCEGLKNLTNQRSYNLRSKNRKKVTVESGSETSSSIEEKPVLVKTADKTKLKKKKNETKCRSLNMDVPCKLRMLQQFAKPSVLSLDQAKVVKKSKEKKLGTLARKRELRDMLEQQDEGYEDDAFEGTPFRSIRPLIKCKLSPIILDTSIQSSATDTEFKTPFSRTPVNRLKPAGPLSTGTSDSDDGIMTPGLLNSANRNDIDRYVNRLKRRNIRIGCKTKIKSRTPLSKEHCRIVQTKSFDFDSNSSAPNSATTESENCDEDYYWSDVD